MEVSPTKIKDSHTHFLRGGKKALLKKHWDYLGNNGLLGTCGFVQKVGLYSFAHLKDTYIYIYLYRYIPDFKKLTVKIYMIMDRNVGFYH